MSVAFRRESDEEHLEPRFELPVPPGPNPVTPRGLAQIEARVTALEARMSTLAEGEERTALARDLRYWRARLATADPVAPAVAGDAVAFGSRVRFRHDGRERSITIVGHDEGDAAAGRVPFAAPLARALIGAGVGETVAFGGRDDAIEVLEIV